MVKPVGFSRMRVISYIKQLEEKFYIECTVRGCRFISLSVSDMLDHEASCDVKSEEKFSYCKYCSHGLNDEHNLSNHMIFSHPQAPEVVNGSVHYSCPLRENKDRISSPKWYQREEYIWRVLLETKGYLVCLVPSCRFVTCILPEMKLHYFDCSPKFWRELKYVCDKCDGKTLTQMEMEAHKSECHRAELNYPFFKSADPRLKTFWTLTIGEFHLSKCATRNCKFVAKTVNELERHFRYCRVPRAENYHECPRCGGWLETAFDLEDHLNDFHPDDNPGNAPTLMSMEVPSPPKVSSRKAKTKRKTPLLPSPSKSPDADDYDNIDIVKQEDGIDEIREELRKVLKPDGTFLGEMAKIIAQECKNTDHPIEVAVRSDDTSFAVKVPDLALASQVVNRRMPSYTLKKVSAQTLEDNLNLLEKSQFSTKIECIQNEPHKKPKPLAFVQENLAAFRILQSLRVHPGGKNVQKSKLKTLKTRMPQKKVEKRKREICPKNSADIAGTQEEDEELVDDPKPAKKLCVSLPSPRLPSPCLSSKNIDASKRPQNPKSYSRKNQNEPSTLESRTIKLKKVCNLKFFPRKKIDIRIPEFEGNEMLHPNMKTYQRSSKKKTPVPSQVNQSRNWLCVEESFSISYEPDPLVGLRSSVKKYGRPQENGFMANLDDLIDTNSAISFTSELIINEWKEYCTMRDSAGPPPPCTADSTIAIDLILETTIFQGYYGELFPWEAKGNRMQIKKEFDIEIKQEFPDRAKSPKTPVSSSGKHNLPLPIKLVNQVARDVVLVQNRDSVLMAFPSGNDTFHIQFNGETKVLQLDDVIYNDDRTNYSNDQIVFVVEKIVHDNPDEMNAAIEATKMRLSKRSAKRSATDSSEAAHPANLNESAGSSRKKTPRLAPGSSSALNDGAGRTAGAIQDSSGESASKDTSKSRPTPGALNSSKNSGSPETKKKRKKKSCKRSLLTFDDLKTEITAEPPMPSTSKIDDPIVGKNLQNARTEITGVGDSPKTRKNSGKKSSKSSKNTRENPPSESDDDSTRFLYIAGDAEKIKKKKIGRPPLRKRNKNGTFHRETPSSDEDNMFLYIGEDAEKAKQQKATKKGKAKAPEGEKKPVQAEQRIMYNSVGFDPYRKVTCAICGEVMTAHTYKSQHLARHNHLCWLEGEEPLNLADERALERLLYNVYVQSKISFKCEQCGVVKKSAKGFLNHRRFCGKSPLERQSLMTPCEYCNRMLMPYSYQNHLLTFHHDLKKDKKEDDPADASPLKLRSAAAKCLENVSKNAQDLNDKTEFIDDEEEQKALAGHDWIKFCYSVMKRRVNRDLKQILQAEIAKDGRAHCMIDGCDFADTSVANVICHYRFCDRKALESKCRECGYMCLLESHMVNHVRINHHDKALVYAKRLLTPQDPVNLSGVVVQGAVIPFVRTTEASSRSHFFLDKCIYLTKQWRSEFVENLVVLPNLEPGDENVFEVVENFPQHMNLLSESMRISFTSSQPEWFSMPKLSSCQIGNANEGAILYVGGLAKTLDWFPSEAEQYLAISVAPIESNKRTDLDVDSSPAHVQIWSCGELNSLCEDFQPSLAFEYAICHEFGVTWDIVCCPGGQPDDNRLGLVALGTSSGKVAIYAPPMPNESFRGKACRLKPAMILELGTDESFPITKITWSKMKPHKHIAAGFSNGLIGVWDLTTTSSLLKLNDSILPFKLFNPHLTIISALSFCPLNDQYLVTGCAEKSFKIWNLNDTSIPQVEHSRGLITDAAWLQYWMGIITCYDDSYSMAMTTASFNTLRNLVYPIQPLITQTESSALSISVNDWLNGYIIGFDSGQVILSFGRKQSAVLNDERRRICVSLMTASFCQFDPLSEATPLCTSYEQAAKEFGVILEHTPQVTNTTKIKPHKFTDLTYFPSLAVNKVCWNVSENCFLTYATAFNLGIVVVSQLKLSRPEFKDFTTTMSKIKDL